MSRIDRNPALSDVMDMEDDVHDVRRWAGVLMRLGEASAPTSAEHLHVIAGSLSDLGHRLEANWLEAFHTAGGVDERA